MEGDAAEYSLLASVAIYACWSTFFAAAWRGNFCSSEPTPPLAPPVSWSRRWKEGEDILQLGCPSKWCWRVEPPGASGSKEDWNSLNPSPSLRSVPSAFEFFEVWTQSDVSWRCDDMACWMMSLLISKNFAVGGWNNHLWSVVLVYVTNLSLQIRWCKPLPMLLCVSYMQCYATCSYWGYSMYRYRISWLNYSICTPVYVCTGIPL